MAIQHTVLQGDCLSSIAAEYGLLWRSVWEHAANAELRALRKDPNVLFPGDVIVVPEKETAEVDRATENRHHFKLKDPPTHIKVRLLFDDAPRANLPFELEVNGRVIKGTTDSQGVLQVPIPPTARTGTLRVGTGALRDIYELGFGTLDPIDTPDGIRDRLEALNFAVEEDLTPAIRKFQRREQLPVTGIADEATRSKLKQLFGQ